MISGLVLNLAPAAAMAQAESARLSTDSSSGAPGDIVTVTVSVSDLVGVTDISTLKFSVAVDPNVLVPAAAAAVLGVNLEAWPKADLAITAEADRFVVTAVTSPPQKVVAGDFVTLSFEVVGTAPDGATSVFDIVGVVDGQPPLLMFDPNDPETGIKVATTDGTFTVVGGLVCSPGDALIDGTINAGDAIVVLRIVTGLLADPSPLQLCNADADENATVDTGDAIHILRTVVGLPKQPSFAGAEIRARTEQSVDGARLILENAQSVHGLQFTIRATSMPELPAAERGIRVAHVDGAVQRVAWADAVSLADLDGRLVLEFPAAANLRVEDLRVFDGAGQLITLRLDEAGVEISVARRVQLGNFPNPFNPSTEVSFELPQAGRVRLELYNARGERVAVLVDGFLPQGAGVVRWDGTDDQGRSVASGVYFARMNTEFGSARHRLMLLK